MLCIDARNKRFKVCNTIYTVNNQVYGRFDITTMTDFHWRMHITARDVYIKRGYTASGQLNHTRIRASRNASTYAYLIRDFICYGSFYK